MRPIIYRWIGVIIYTSVFSLATAQSSPCDCAQRWNAGGAWVNGIAEENPGPGDSPLGIARCNNDKESKISSEGCVYNPADFLIDCSAQAPAVGDEVIWINFDVQALVAIFNLKISPKGTTNIGWALYASEISQNGTNPPNGVGEELSGDCNLLTLVTCSDVSRAFVEINDLDFNNTTNYYLSIWSTSNKALKNVTLTIKDGCVDCSEPPALACYSQINVSLGNNGEAIVYPSDFISSVSDLCTAVEDLNYEMIVPSKEIITNYPPGQAASTWTLNCSNIGASNADIWVEDLDGSWAFCTVNLNVEDKLPPTITCPDAIEVSFCDIDITDLNLMGIATAIDNCTPFTIEYTDSEFPNGCGGQVITRTWSATDDYGNVSQCNQQITMGPVVPLLETDILWPAEYIAPECGLVPGDLGSEMIPAPYNLPIINSSQCQLVGYSYQDVVFDLCGDLFKILRTWTVLDWCSASIFEQVQLIKNVCTSPVAICAANVNISLGFDGQFLLTPDIIDAGSNDGCGNLLEFRLRESDGSAGVPATTSILLTCADIGVPLVVEMWVGNGTGGWSYCNSTINVEDKLPPTITCPDAIEVSFCDIDITDLNLMGIATAIDNCTPFTIEYTDSEFPNGCGGQVITRTWSATDDYGNVSQCNQQITMGPVVPLLETDILWPAEYIAPECGLVPGDLGSEMIPAPYNLPIINSSQCQLVGYSYQDVVFDLCGDLFKILRTWTVLDWCSASIFEQVQLIKNVCTSPVAICAANVNISLGFDGQFLLTPDIIDAGSNDGCGNLLEFRLRESDGSAGVPATTSILLTCADIGVPLVVEMWVGNGTGGWSYCNSTINVEDKLPPTITCPDAIEVSFCDIDITDLNLMGIATAIDNCTPFTIEYTDSEFPNGCGGQVITRTWSATDDYGNVSQCNQQITMGPVVPLLETDILWPAEYIAPECGLVPGDLGSEMIPAPYNLPIINSSQCQLVGYSYQDVVFDLCGDLFKILRTWTVLDWCSASIFEQVQLIKNVCTSPVAICAANVNISLGFDGQFLLTPDIIDAGSNDGCGNLLEFRLRESDGSAGVPATTSILLTCADIGVPLVVEMWVGNGTGGWSYCNSTINVEDKLPPTITCPDAIEVSFCDIDITDLNLMGIATAIDNCTPFTIEYTDSEFPNGCGGQVITRTWSATDDYGNVSQCNQQITMGPVVPLLETDILWPAEYIAPECGLVPGDLGSEMIPAPYNLPIINSSQCQLVGYSYQDVVFDLCGDLFKILRTWTVLDWCSASIFEQVQLIKNVCTSPVAICAANVNISLGFDGQFLLTPDIIDAGSNDGCGNLLEFRLRKSDGSAGVPATTSILLTCADIGVPLVVEMWVGNGTGGWSYCNTTINVEDKVGACATTITNPGNINFRSLDNDEFIDTEVFPNPTDGLINILTTVEDPDNTKIEVAGLSGKIVHTIDNFEFGSNRHILDLRLNSSSSVLILRIIKGDRIEIKKVFVINR